MDSRWILPGVLLVLNGGLFLAWALFTWESVREGERRAPRFGWAGMGVHALLAVLILVWPASRGPLATHKLVRFVLRRSLPAQMLFPHIDNLLYGRRWRPRPPPDWLAYPGRARTQDRKDLKKDA